MKRFTLLLISILLVNLLYANEYNTIKENYKKLLLFEGEEYLTRFLLELPKEEYYSDQVVVELTDRYPMNNIGELLSNLNANGSWNNIDYTSKERSNWKPKIHVERILLMSRAYNTKEHEYYQSKELLKQIHNTLKYWFEAKHMCPNWWYNQIGTPKTLGMISILMENELSEQEKESIIEILKRAKISMTGQNKVWLSGIVLVRGLLEGDNALVKQARDSIASEIVIGKGKNEGIKTDWSFHQHGAQQQFGNYGASYISNMSFWGKVFSRTSFALNQAQLDLLKDLIVKGFNKILWKGYMDVNGLGRQMFKQAQKHKAFATAFSANLLASIDDKNQQQYNKLIESNITRKDKENEDVGLYHFWLSDQTINKTPTWMTSVKMSSNRVIGAEGGNGDNRMGYYLADGATYTYIEGDEYYNIMPNWNWRHIPGITAHQTNLPYKELKWLGGNNKADFVGNVNNGEYGFTVMDFNRDALKAEKMWIFTPKYTLCRGLNISSDSLCEVHTTIEQSLKKSELLHWEKENYEWVTINSVKEFEGEQRFYHNKTGYIILKENNIIQGDKDNNFRNKKVITKTIVSVEKRTSSWNGVMNSYPKDYMGSNEVVSIYINHGVQPKEQTYSYIILPNVTKEEVESFRINDISIFNKLLVIGENIFSYSKNSIDLKFSGIKSELEVSTSKAGIIMSLNKNKKWDIYYSDPTQKLSEIEMSVNGKTKTLYLPKEELKGTSIKY